MRVFSVENVVVDRNVVVALTRSSPDLLHLGNGHCVLLCMEKGIGSIHITRGDRQRIVCFNLVHFVVFVFGLLCILDSWSRKLEFNAFSELNDVVVKTIDVYVNGV